MRSPNWKPIAMLAGLVLAVPACAARPEPPTPTPPAAPIPSVSPTDAAAVTASKDDAAAPRPLVGRWRVVGCETSPGDPADCARGEIVFTTERVTIEVGASDRVSRPYRVVSLSHDRIVLDVAGAVSEIAVDADGEMSWRAPGLGGRVGRLSFVRARDDGSR